jgi:hypothetical protein
MRPRPILSFVEKGERSPGRVLAPFTDKGADLPFSKRYLFRESFYCHGYRLVGEHYHRTLIELEDCPLLRPAGWQPPVRKVEK